MTGRMLTVPRLAAKDLAGGGVLAGRVHRRRVKQGPVGAFVEYLGDFTLWPLDGHPKTAARLVLPHGLEGPDHPIPRGWKAGDFAGLIEGASWTEHTSSPLAVDLPTNIGLALLSATAAQKQLI